MTIKAPSSYRKILSSSPGHVTSTTSSTGSGKKSRTKQFHQPTSTHHLCSLTFSPSLYLVPNTCFALMDLSYVVLLAGEGLRTYPILRTPSHPHHIAHTNVHYTSLLQTTSYLFLSPKQQPSQPPSPPGATTPPGLVLETLDFPLALTSYGQRSLHPIFLLFHLPSFIL